MKSAEARAAKWAARMQGEALSPIMQKKLAAALPLVQAAAEEAEAVESVVRSILNAQTSGVTYIQTPFYLNFGRQCYAKSKTFGGQALAIEVAAIAALWQSRGLQSATLLAVSDALGIPTVSA